MFKNRKQKINRKYRKDLLLFTDNEKYEAKITVKHLMTLFYMLEKE